jgi:hypothetical protein
MVPSGFLTVHKKLEAASLGGLTVMHRAESASGRRTV